MAILTGKNNKCMIKKDFDTATQTVTSNKIGRKNHGPFSDLCLWR